MSENNVDNRIIPIIVLKPEEQQRLSERYKNLEIMRELKSKPMPHFQTGPLGPRSFNTWIDDSERMLNGYTLSRDAQGKEEWQSNLNDNIIRAKQRAIAASVGLVPPDISMVAINKDGVRSSKRADIFKNITKQTYLNENQTLNTFLQVWRMMSHGVIFEHEGYMTGGAMQEVVESFDSRTGEVKTKKEYRKMDGKPFSVIINPNNFFWWTFYVNDIQDQPRIAWVENYNKYQLEVEFSKYKNYKYIKDKQTVKKLHTDQQTQLFYSEWNEHVEDNDDFQVVRTYDKVLDRYSIDVNGVPILETPLLWGEKEKIYPFTKEISEPFANSNFFVGMTFPAILEAYQDGKNTTLNTLIDKLYRSIDPLKLVGLENRDLFDVEMDIVSQDNTIYVPNINSVKFMEHPGINQGELAMLQILDRGIESTSISSEQQGSSGSTQKTARQAVIEDKRAREIKGILFVYLENLWIQKYKIRTEVILSHYLKDKAIREDKKGQIITIKDYTFADGERGILDIHVANGKSSLLKKEEIEAREGAMEQQGVPYKLISILKTYLNDWKYDFKVVSKSFENREKADIEDEYLKEIQTFTTLYPEFFVSNKERFLRDYLKIRGKEIGDFNFEQPQSAPPEGIEQPPQPQPRQEQQQLPVAQFE